MADNFRFALFFFQIVGRKCRKLNHQRFLWQRPREEPAILAESEFHNLTGVASCTATVLKQHRHYNIFEQDVCLVLFEERTLTEEQFILLCT